MVDDFMLDDSIIKNKGHLGADILNNIIRNLSIADEAIEEACHEINKHDELYEMHFESFENDIQDFNKFRWEYEEFTRYADEYDAMVDSNYKSRMESICEQLSDIRLENITIGNNLGITEKEVSHYDTFGGTRLKHKINIEDVLGVEYVDKAMKAEYEERRQMVQAMQKMVEEDNWPEGTSEDTKEAVRQYLSNLNGGKMESYDDEIKNLLTKGEFNFITDKEQNLSLALDFVPLVGDIKGVIEAIQGKEMITNRELSDGEKTMAGISSAVGFIPGVGKAGTLAKAGGKLGAKAMIKDAAKYAVKETMKGAGMYGASSIATNLGISPKDQLMAMGGFSLYKGGKAILKNSNVKATVNNTVDITKATVKDAIASNKGSAILSSNLGGYGGQLYNSLKKVTAERKALREGIASGESSISRVPGNINNIKLQGTITKGVSNPNAKEIIAERVNGLDLSEHRLTNKQLSSNKMSEIKSKIDNRTATKAEYKAYEWNKKFSARRREGVKQFWNQERERIINGETTTRNWTTEQIQNILNGKTPKYEGKSIQGHHSYSASKYPHLADKGEIIYPTTPHEHLRGWHGGNYKNSSPGEPIIDIKDF